ncbi:hypothetical protein H9L21_09495 [Aeromicrobium senzhongii]|uniref:Lipoprotein n=1 Tax=Aeromicrobium senzhongii TaxID=2663859 RepID=A0ABX6SQJ9_9ACTN|nr:hypothetical protein [Aeromicrobium senzhongii]MTB86797.1 hypothetical protein [Aeromicrobium senzhongii]QNL93362.1 hypothetical protein H9L21_09495 [Aeromicrobium senzhongii]
MVGGLLGARRPVIAVVLVLALSACSGDPDGLSAQGSLADLRKAGMAILESASEGEASVEAPARDVPCGGLGGNEWNKISYSYEAAAGVVEDADASLARAIAAIEDLGIRHDGVQQWPSGPGVSFYAEGFNGGVFVHEDGALEVRAQTDCLDNPER